jgi:AraC-like DNA-binding protein
LSIADIALSCGFSDASHLGREFRKEFGESPNAYRVARPQSQSPAIASNRQQSPTMAATWRARN